MRSAFPFRALSSRARLGVTAAAAALLLPNVVSASFHLWQIRELYTNLDGSVQFIEIFTGSSGQQFVGGQTIQVVQQGTGTTHTFTFPGNAGTPTNNHAVLIATASITGLGGPTPDFTLPAGFLFSDASTITMSGTVQGGVPYASLPTNGSQSLAIPGNTTQPNSPQNFAGTVGSVPEPMTWGLIGVGGLGLSLILRRRSA